MELIKNMFVDNLNGFPVAQIPLFLFQLLVAGLLAHLLQWIANKKYSTEIISNAALKAVGIAVIASIVKNDVAYAVLGAAVILLFLTRNKEKSDLEFLGQFLIIIVGVGCGVGSVIQIAMGISVVALLVLFTPLKK